MPERTGLTGDYVMHEGELRRAAVAGSWYPSNPAVLERQVDDYLDAAHTTPVAGARAIVAPHAGLM